MRSFLEQYGVGIFVLILVSILISFTSPLGNTIKTAINEQLTSVDEIGEDSVANTQTYTIIFDGNGATSGSMESMQVVCGKSFKIPECKFKKDGAEFSGFWTTKNGNIFTINKDYKDLTTKGKTITIYARWGCRFDLNAILDGKPVYHEHNYGTCDIYINGELVGKGVSDFGGFYKIGTTYEIKNIKPTSDHTYLGLKVGETLSGAINQTTYIDLIFNTIT